MMDCATKAAELVWEHLEQYLGPGDATILVSCMAESINKREAHWALRTLKALGYDGHGNPEGEPKLRFMHPDGAVWVVARAGALADEARREWEVDDFDNEPTQPNYNAASARERHELAWRQKRGG